MSSRYPLVVIVCNALDDATRLERRISTDSPAASRKVFLMAQALRLAGIRPIIMSLGRGRADNSGDFFASKVCRVDRVPILYAPFSHWSVISKLFSLFGLLMPILRLSRHPKRAVIFYNRTPAFLLLLRLAYFLGYRTFLDLEDGEVNTGRFLKDLMARIVVARFDRYCDDGALLACKGLKSITTVRPIYHYYGTAFGGFTLTHWQTNQIRCLMSGTLSSETGAQLLIDAIRLMRIRKFAWAKNLSFEVTGKGDSLVEFKRLAAEPGMPLVHVHGRISDLKYLDILRNCHVGLALKPVGGVLADTTFPSKVIEFSDSGLLVLSTDISDVRHLLGDAARYIERNDPELLVERLCEIVSNPKASAYTARKGCKLVQSNCAPQRTGESLRRFLFRSDE